MMRVGRETLRQGSFKLAGPAKGIGTRLEGGANLPYRPLLGKGDGEEYPDIAIWQRILWGYLEPQSHQQRAGMTSDLPLHMFSISELTCYLLDIFQGAVWHRR